MKSKRLALLSSCLLASTILAEEKTTRDYTMIDLHNRLATQLLDVGTTSITFSVEWPLDIEMPHGRFSLMGKLDIEERGWHFLTSLKFDHIQDQGKVTFEIPYNKFSWAYSGWAHEFKDYEKKAFFAVRIPGSPRTPLGAPRGMYEEDDETDFFDVPEKTDEETPSTEAKQAEQKGRVQASPPSRANVATASLPLTEDETQRLEAVATIDTPPNRLWLYLAILPFILAILYFMRKKKP